MLLGRLVPSPAQSGTSWSRRGKVVIVHEPPASNADRFGASATSESTHVLYAVAMLFVVALAVVPFAVMRYSTLGTEERCLTALERRDTSPCSHPRRRVRRSLQH